MLPSVYVFPFFFFFINSEIVAILFMSAVNYCSLLRAKFREIDCELVKMVTLSSRCYQGR